MILAVKKDSVTRLYNSDELKTIKTSTFGTAAKDHEGLIWTGPGSFFSSKHSDPDPDPAPSKLKVLSGTGSGSQTRLETITL
jgi:hypothetical protein